MENLEIELAIKARENAYAPYSNYCVGCVLKTKTGKLFTGCNVENDGIQSICAERVAFVKAISEGERDFEYLIVCGGKKGNNLEKCLPCGYCRQFISEFVSPDFKIYTIDNEKKTICYSISELLPDNFRL